MDIMEKITSLCKRRGFIFPGSELYGGLAGTWDYGPLGVEMKNNLRRAWWRRFVQERDDVVGIEGNILMPRKVWQASGHESGFIDLLVECKKCHQRFRVDHLTPPLRPFPPEADPPLEEDKGRKGGIRKQGKTDLPKCPNCGGQDWTDPREFKLMFETYVGPVRDEENKTYLRGETAQSMFTNFKNVMESSRKKPPFGIAQMGRCFRNEIVTGNFTFRSREFDIAEVEYFVKPGEDDKWFEGWLNEWERFLLDLGLEKKNLRLYEHPKESLAHYSKRTVDLQYKFPFGWDELAGVANRTDYDLSRHEEYSGQDLKVYDEEAKKKYWPYVIEPTLGVDRLMLAFLVDAYDEVAGGRTTTTESTKEEEVVLRLSAELAPIKIAVLPLTKKEPLKELAQEIYQDLRHCWKCDYDEKDSIGRRYRRQDEVGTPYCLTLDFESLEDKKVTVRDRDTMKQERIAIRELEDYFCEKLE